MEIPRGNTLEKAQVTSPEAISGIADSLKLEEQKLIEWLSKQEGRKLTSQEEHLSGFKRLTAFRTARERHRLVAYNLNHLATMRF